MSSGIPKLSLTEHVDAIAANLPNGRVWTPKFRNDSNLRKLLRGFAPTARAMDAAIQRFVGESVPSETEDFLTEWETALGIPDPCFPLAITDDQRRRNIKIKLSVLAGISTRQDFIDLAALFGLLIDVNSGIDHVVPGSGGYGTALPVLTIPGDFATVAVARMTMVVTENSPASIAFPWEFSPAGPVIPVGLKFALDDQNTLRCLIRKLAPANIDVLFVEA